MTAILATGENGAGAGPASQSGGAAGAETRRRGRSSNASMRASRSSIAGFEDVTDEAADSEPRRVHWTIIKRMVADQQSGKPISAVYVLQRDGVDTEFPNLGTARAAANKTIVHPEKLTLSKAEHAAAKGDGAAPKGTGDNASGTQLRFRRWCGGLPAIPCRGRWQGKNFPCRAEPGRPAIMCLTPL